MMSTRTRWKAMMGRDPWAEIDPPSIAYSVTALRVDANLPWDFFWARGVDGRVLLTLRHATNSAPTAQLPRLRDIEVTLSPPDESGTQLLAFKLLDSNHRDIFQTLCQDIISAATQAESEAVAVSAALSRTWRWHHLLRGGQSSLLSPEQQKGLLGELFVLERLLLPRMDASSAVTAWRGPLGAPKDFEIARVAIEAKTRRGGATPSVSITSESQLDESGVDALFLHVAELDEAPMDGDQGVTLHDVAERIRGPAPLCRSWVNWNSRKHDSQRRATGWRTTTPATAGWRGPPASIWCPETSPASPQARSVRVSLMYATRSHWPKCEPFATLVGTLDEGPDRTVGPDDDRHC